MHDEFAGVIGRDWRDSTPAWPARAEAPEGAPNVVYVVLDDVGYAQLGCYGSIIETPNIDALAAAGVRLANFHTAALCSPTRSCLLTGRNHHSNGMGRVADLAMAYPGYSGEVPPENGFLSEILRAEGYSTYAVGKWHLTPDDETHMAADRSSWPIGRGFDRWYGFHGGETHQFVPTLYCDNHSVQPPRTVAEGYHLTEDLVDHAIEFLSDHRNVDGEQPFFLYFCTGACHSPHHAPPQWIEKYRGVFDDGWDALRERVLERQIATGIVPAGTELSARPPWVPAWDDLEPDDRKVAARFMECFAGFLSHTDAEIGRLLAHLEDSGDADNTIIVLVSDNGASAEGGATGSINDVRMINRDPAGRREMRERIGELGGPSLHNNYPWGWTMAGNTPFKRWKREVHEGGVADPCIVRWPARYTGDAGQIRHQFAHAIDVLPTVLELIGVESPATIRSQEQSPIHGTSFAYLLGEGGATAPGRRVTQHFEMLGSRALYDHGWKAVTFKPLGPLSEDLSPNSFNAPFDDDVWELYHVAEDPSEVHDRAADEPERLAAHGRTVVGGGGSLPRVAARQPHHAHHPQSAAAASAATQPLPVPPARRTGARERGRRRTKSVAHDHRERRRARGRHARRCAARARVRAGRVVLPPARRTAAVRAQPVRQDARRHHVRRRRRPGPARAGVPLREGRRRRGSRRAAPRR